MRSRIFRQPPEVPIRTDESAPRLTESAAPARVWVSDDDPLTQIARAYRCPSHGRSPRARVLRDGDGVESFEGVCCREAQAAILASARLEQDAEQVVSDEGTE